MSGIPPRRSWPRTSRGHGRVTYDGRRGRRYEAGELDALEAEFPCSLMYVNLTAVGREDEIGRLLAVRRVIPEPGGPRERRRFSDLEDHEVERNWFAEALRMKRLCIYVDPRGYIHTVRSHRAPLFFPDSAPTTTAAEEEGGNHVA